MLLDQYVYLLYLICNLPFKLYITFLFGFGFCLGSIYFPPTLSYNQFLGCAIQYLPTQYGLYIQGLSTSLPE